MARKSKNTITPTATFEEQKKTLRDAKRLLKKYHKCLIVRPTGFGKTWMLTELIRSYKKVLYLYPSAVVANTVVDRYYDMDLEQNNEEDAAVDPETIKTVEDLKASNEIENCDLMTYAMLIRKSNNQLTRIAHKYDLIICDEAHRLGGPKTKIAMEHLFAKAAPETDFIGATATPTRMDNFDVASHFYGDRLTYIYTLFDAIEAGIIKKPNYCYATYDARKDLEDGFRAKGQDISDKDVKTVIDAKLIEIAKLYNMPNIIREVCGKYAKGTSYMKFIVFFASKKHMTDKLGEVVGWFHEAYPDHEIETLKISSRNKTEQHNTDRLNMLPKKRKLIHLIACIDMLNLGYHVSNQTGIMMYRGTKSNTIFTQQLGRALSAGADNSAIVFDIVDNLHNKAVYELYVRDPKTRKKGESHAPRVAALDNYILDPKSNRILMETADGQTVETQYSLDKKSGKIVDRNGNESTFEYDPDTGTIRNTADIDSPSRDINRITPACLHATGHEAKYKEIIAKAMAEPLVQRCKYALQIHFRSWCLVHNVPYPISDEKLTDMYGLEMRDFYEEFKKVVKANKIAYPLSDAKKLLAIGQGVNNTDVPLSICCEARGVSIDQLTDMIFKAKKGETDARA